MISDGCLQSDDLSRSIATEDVALVRLERAKLSPGKEQKDTPQFINLELSFVINGMLRFCLSPILFCILCYGLVLLFGYLFIYLLL